MFDDDDLFNLTDDSFEWDLLLDDDELEQDRRKRQGEKARQTPSRSVRRALWLTAASLCLYT